MSRPPRLQVPAFDWDELGRSLTDFSLASSAIVSVFDEQRRRIIGPLSSTLIGSMLEEAGAWSPGGWATGVELELIDACARSGQVERARTSGGLQVAALPLKLDTVPRAFVVFGWVLRTFPVPLAAEVLARELDTDFATVWRAFRATTPVAGDTYESIERLLVNLVDTMARLTESRGRAEQLLAMRELFLLKVSHELRTPLQAISLRAAVLKQGLITDPARRAHDLEGIARSVIELDLLIEDVIDVARSETGQLAMRRRPVSIVDPLDAAMAALSPRADAKGVQLVQAFDREQAKDVIIDGDSARLRQVFWNIGSNAIKFTPRGGAVKVTVAWSEPEVEIALTDTGVGIAADELPLIFDEFHSRRTDNPTGLGLGLTIVRQIVLAHGGTVRARSEGIGHGTTMTVTLSRLPAAGPNS